MAWKSAGVPKAAAMRATCGSIRRRASITTARSSICISGSGWPPSSVGTDWLTTKMPPDEPGRTSSTPAAASSFMASRSVGG